MLVCRRQTSLNGFKFGTFIGRFSSDGAEIMAVKGLNIHERESIYLFVGFLELSKYIRKTDERAVERRLTYTNYYGDDNVCNIYK